MEENELEGLEPLQYEDIYREADSPLMDVLKGTLRTVTYIGVAVTMLLIIAGFTIKIPKQLTFPFLIKGNQQENIYRYPSNIYIEKAFVKANANVKKGDRLLEITSPAIVDMIAEYKSAKSNIDYFEKNELLKYENLKKSLELKLEKLSYQETDVAEEKEQKGKIKESNMAKLKFELEQAKKQFETDQKLFKESYISEQEFKESETKKIIAENNWTFAYATHHNDSNKLKNLVQQLTIEKKLTADEIDRLQIEINNTRKKLQIELQKASENILHNYGDFFVEGGGLILMAPYDAKVSYVFEGDKEVPAGAFLLKLLNKTSQYHASFYVNSNDIGYIKNDQPAVLKINTFPHYNWGVLKGKVSAISLTPDEKGLFPAEIEITDLGKLKNLLQIGMTGETNVIVSEKSFFENIFEDLKKGYDTVF